MLHYILQTLVFQLIFLIVYDVFLKRETFFNTNRIYLLTTVLLSILLPFIKFESFKTIIPKEFVVALPEVIIGAITPTIETSTRQTEVIANSYSWSWHYVLFIGMAFALLLFIYKAIKFYRLYYKNPKRWKGNLLIIDLLKSNAAFSFFNYVFLGESLKPKEKASILEHERVHAEQKHSLDLLFFELLRILFWFNPLVYIYQNRIANLHEYIADAKTVKFQTKENYYQSLLSQVFNTKHISFINPFFKQSLIKKRIIMLSKSKSKQVRLFKYSMLIPLVLGMLVYTSCEKEAINAENNNSILEKINQLETAINENGKLTIEEKEALSKLALNSRLENLLNVKVEGTKFVEKENLSETSFHVVEEVPIFPGCESLISNEERRKCMSSNIAQFVNKNFNTNLAKSLDLSGKQKIYVAFKIDKTGQIVNARARAPHPDLAAEAKRVVQLLPNMQAGKQKGKPVIVPYSLPILFQIED